MKVDLAPHPRAAAQARAAATDFLEQEAAPRGTNREDALLIVSELVTNAVKAGAHRVSIELRLKGRALTIQVEDDAHGWPAAQHPGDDAESGRGLAIVGLLADTWDVRKTRRGKKVVATLRIG
jgi:anti-sigma regulatory factor (Ser/Thr protein kinase)